MRKCLAAHLLEVKSVAVFLSICAQCFPLFKQPCVRKTQDKLLVVNVLKYTIAAGYGYGENSHGKNSPDKKKTAGKSTVFPAIFDAKNKRMCQKKTNQFHGMLCSDSSP